MGVGIRFKINDVASKRVLSNLLHMNTFPLMDEIGSILDSNAFNRMQQGIDPEGNRWEPSQRAIREGGQTLIDHEHLRDSITHIAASDGNSVEHGTDMIYGPPQHFGGQVGRNRSVTLVARPFIGVSADDEGDIADAVNVFMRSQLQ